MSERWGDSKRDRDALDKWITDEERLSFGEDDLDMEELVEKAQKPYSAREPHSGAFPPNMLARLPEKAPQRAEELSARRLPTKCPNCYIDCVTTTKLGQHLRFECKALDR